jgi:hypothetical protein
MTADCGAAEWLVDGVHCLKISRDVPSLVEQMARILDGEVDLERLGAAGQRIAKGELSAGRALADLERFLSEAGPVDATRLDDPELGPAARDLDHRALLALYADLQQS